MKCTKFIKRSGEMKFVFPKVMKCWHSEKKFKNCYLIVEAPQSLRNQ